MKSGLLLVGAALAAWYFLDPKKGPERRQKYATKARDAYDNASQELNRLGKEFSDKISEVADRVSSEFNRMSEYRT